MKFKYAPFIQSIGLDCSFSDVEMSYCLTAMPIFDGTFLITSIGISHIGIPQRFNNFCQFLERAGYLNWQAPEEGQKILVETM